MNHSQRHSGCLTIKLSHSNGFKTEVSLYKSDLRHEVGVWGSGLGCWRFSAALTASAAKSIRSSTPMSSHAAASEDKPTPVPHRWACASPDPAMIRAASRPSCIATVRRPSMPCGALVARVAASFPMTTNLQHSRANQSLGSGTHTATRDVRARARFRARFRVCVGHGRTSDLQTTGLHRRPELARK
eukprot:3931746-Rhodomonas_salina.2